MEFDTNHTAVCVCDYCHVVWTDL